jgi:hypothetical protein
MRNAVLCCAVLCCAVLCCAVLERCLICVEYVSFFLHISIVVLDSVPAVPILRKPTRSSTEIAPLVITVLSTKWHTTWAASTNERTMRKVVSIGATTRPIFDPS